MIQALQSLDRVLCQSVDSKIEPLMVLEDIEAGSIKIWLANALQRVDDDGLKTLDWKPVFGKYLVRTKYAYIKWVNKEDKDQGLLGLAKEMKMLAQEVDIKHIQDHMPPSIQELSEITKKVESAKQILLPTDKIAFMSKDEKPIDFDLSVRWSDEELSDLAIKETTKFEKMPITLIVKRPDYLGKSKWDFRHGKKQITAKIEDLGWLNEFQSRKVDIRPGDALRCLVTIEHKYGFDNELAEEEYTVTKVEGVSENQMRQPGLDL